MQNITTISDLKNAIQLLEVELDEKGQELKKQFYLTYDSLKPVSLLKSTLKDITSSPYLIENLVGTATGLATGYLSKKIVVGTSGNIIRKLFGSVLQFGVTNLVAQHPDTIKSFGQYVYQHFLKKKKVNPENNNG
jgi:hypothetical protein